MSEWTSENWASFLGNTLRGASEGFATANGTAGTRAGGAGTAGVVQYDNQSAQAYSGDQKADSGMMKWLLIGAAVLAGVVVLKKVL